MINFALGKSSRQTLGCAAVLFACVANNVEANVITSEPGDNAPLPAGTDTAILYFQHAERNSVMEDNHKVSDGYNLKSDVFLARYVKWIDLNGILVTPQVIVPWGSLNLNGDRETGFGDPFIGSTTWLYNDPVKEHYFSVGTFIAMPLGEYDSDRGGMNMGENRWKGVLELNYVHALVPHKLYGEITLERDWYGKNDDYLNGTLKQAPAFEVQTHLRYVVNESNQVGLTYLRTTGGEHEFNGEDLGDGLNSSKYLVTWAHFFTPKTQIQTQLGQDIEVRNGPKENARVNIRLAHLF
uniref:transporter n=1 Tax=Pseudomonas laurentiana TaxID=2364649 RepID=UPI0029C99516|nr:transporter [Pseudomonas laurentiana]